MKKILIITLLTIIIIAQTSVAQRIYNPINGHLYEKFDTPMTWDDAKAYCESLDGYLATVTSQEEQNWIWNTLYPYRCNFGATDAEEEGVWKWVTGEPWDYTNWDAGEPGGGINENIIEWFSANGRWHDAPENWEIGFVCEYEPAGEIFISPDGSDEDGNGSPENPYRTIQHGIDMARYGDVIRVAAGPPYAENIILHSDIVVLGSGADQTTITANTGNVVTANVLNVTLAGFTIDGQGTADNGISCGDGTYAMMINDNIITGAAKGIRCSDSANVSIWSNTIRQNIEDGVYCDASANADIKNNTIEQNGGDGILCVGSTHATIEDNTISQNITDGIYCAGTSVVIIDKNSTEANGSYGIMCEGQTNTQITENLVYQNWRGIFGGQNAVIVIEGNEIRENSVAVHCVGSTKVEISSNHIANNDNGIDCHNTSEANIVENLIYSNKWAIFGYDSSHLLIARNIIKHNTEGGIYCGEYWDDSFELIIGGSLINANQIINNTWRAVWNRTGKNINATYNYWGTTNEDEIAAMMINEGDGSIDFIPFVGDPRIVGDASGDGTISALDAAYILQFTVGLIDKLPVSMSKSPQHIVPRDYELSLPNLAVKPNERFLMPIAINDATGLNYGGVIIKYDPSALKAVDVAALGMLSGSYWKANTLTGEVRFAFATPLPMEGKGNLLMIDFEALPNTTGRESPLIFDTVEIPESRNIKTINGSVAILPERTMLLQNYPNPFNPETWLPFQLAEDAVVILRIYNQNGQLVRTLHLGAMPAGMYTSKDKAAYWDGRDTAGEKVASGVYFYTLLAGDFLAMRKLVLMK